MTTAKSVTFAHLGGWVGWEARLGASVTKKTKVKLIQVFLKKVEETVVLEGFPSKTPSTLKV